uniref:Uncharacterized protein n=1 Tax=Amphimedon queenslandica TaxID=400682 RepID=A0A1X7SXW7_AMPQE
MCQVLGLSALGNPENQVQAVVVKITPLLTPVINTDFDTLETVVRALFQYRRKMIRHSAKLLFPDEYSHLSTELFLRSGVDQTLRAQQLTLEDFKSLCTHYTELIKGVGGEWWREKKKKKKTVKN